MRVLITGGTGLIGRHLVAELSRAGHESVILTRNPHKSPELPPNTDLAVWDARLLGDWAEIVDTVDAVINLAGESIGSWPWTPNKKRKIQESREIAGELLTKAIARAGNRPKVLIQASAVGYYGARDNTPIDETDPPGSDWLSQVAVKWESSTAEVEKLNVRRAIIRTGLVLTPRGGLLAKFILPFRFFVGGRLGTGEQFISWVHINDVVAAIRFLIENSAAHGPFNLTAPNPVTNATFSRVLGKLMRRPAWLPIPSFPIRLVLGQMSQLVLSGQRVFPKRLESLGYDFESTHLEQALTTILSTTKHSYHTPRET